HAALQTPARSRKIRSETYVKEKRRITLNLCDTPLLSVRLSLFCHCRNKQSDQPPDGNRQIVPDAVTISKEARDGQCNDQKNINANTSAVNLSSDRSAVRMAGNRRGYGQNRHQDVRNI